MEKQKTIKLNLGCGPLPLHPQHLQIMQEPEEWTLVDLYVKHPLIKNWDASHLTEVDDGSVSHIYSSHTLEHLSHRQVPIILKHWWNKLKKGGIITLNVPDLVWACKQIMRYENMQPLTSGVYTTFEGNNVLQSILYGTHAHEGEYHKAGFTPRSLERLLDSAGFSDIIITPLYDNHDMGVLFATAIK